MTNSMRNSMTKIVIILSLFLSTLCGYEIVRKKHKEDTICEMNRDRQCICYDIYDNSCISPPYLMDCKKAQIYLGIE